MKNEMPARSPTSTKPGGRSGSRGRDVPGADVVEHAVEHQRCRFDAAQGLQFVIPGDAEFIDIAFVNQIERAVALRIVIAAIHEPLTISRRQQPGGVDILGQCGLKKRAAEERHRECECC
jgi:hypothetical protein